MQRLSQSRLARLREELPQREHQILQRIGQHGYLTTDQVQRFVFTDHASDDTAGRITRRVLGRLEQAGLIGSLRRRQGGLLGGSAPTTWHLSPGGARFLSSQTAGYRRRTPSLRHLLHSVAVAEAHLQAHRLRRQHSGDQHRHHGRTTLLAQPTTALPASV
ncbi:hypothetical protein G5V59_13000 [Nocardioides sp. W3-2-3]|uniref:replication-relaxation family protein n=1 Tax=Nocardioides convexus TaxID=2712224 RepID=UPI002418776E|nr:replication-relaxation family protein [Nocardioides convexus]NHA00632.1 hypothetical protein [Nocardioides convexus]